MKYIKKPIVIEAVQIRGNVKELESFIGDNGEVTFSDAAWEVGKGRPVTTVVIHTLEGDMKASDGDYIIKGVKGEFYPCRKDIFEQTYDVFEPDAKEE